MFHRRSLRHVQTPFVAGAAFTPASLSPALWLEAAAANVFKSNAGTGAVSADGDTVGFWTDLSGNSFNLTSVADDTTRPTWQSNSGHPYVSFDGTNDMLRKLSNLGMYNVSGCSIFAAVNGIPAINVPLVAGNNTGAAQPRYEPICSENGTATNEVAALIDDAGVGFGVTGTAASFWAASDQICGVIDDTSNMNPYVDQTAKTARAYTRGAHTITSNCFSLGARLRNTTGGWFATKVYGIVIVNSTLNSTDRQNLITYLATLQGRSI